MGLPPLPLDLGRARGWRCLWAVVWGVRARSRFSFSFGSGRSGSCPLAVDSFYPPLRLRCLSPIQTARSTTWKFEGDFGVLPPRVYPPVVLDLRIEEQGRIRGPGHLGVALVDVAVVLALTPLPVRGRER